MLQMFILVPETLIFCFKIMYGELFITSLQVHRQYSTIIADFYFLSLKVRRDERNQ